MKSKIINIVLLNILLIVLYFAFEETIRSLINSWDQPEYSHGYLIPIISLWLIISKKISLNTIDYNNKKKLFFLFSSYALYYIAFISSVTFIERLGFVCFIISGFYYCLDKNEFRRINFPVFYLFLCIPPPLTLWSTINDILKYIIIAGVGKIFYLVSLPYFIEGYLISIPGKVLEIANACSGVNSLQSLIAIGLLASHFLNANYVKKSIILLSTIPIAILVNLLRVALMGVLFYYYNFNIIEGFTHDITGIILFFIELIFLSIVYRGLNDKKIV